MNLTHITWMLIGLLQVFVEVLCKEPFLIGMKRSLCLLCLIKCHVGSIWDIYYLLSIMALFLIVIKKCVRNLSLCWQQLDFNFVCQWNICRLINFPKFHWLCPFFMVCLHWLTAVFEVKRCFRWAETWLRLLLYHSWISAAWHDVLVWTGGKDISELNQLVRFPGHGRLTYT